MGRRTVWWPPLAYNCGMLTSFLTRVCLLGCLMALWAPVAAGQVAADQFIVGVLRANGIIIPFARYDGTHWANSWPEPIYRTPAPLEQIPREWLGGNDLTPNWRLWLPAGSTHAVRVLDLQYADTGCDGNWGLSTDFPKSLNVKPNNCPHPTIGIALSSGQPLQPMLPANHSDLPFSALERAFKESEDREISALRVPSEVEYLRPPDADSRTAVPIRVARAWRTILNSGVMIYYIEANRSYPRPAGSPDSGCDNISAFRGWFVRRSFQEARVLHVRLSLTGCDFKGDLFATPMGLMVLQDGTYVITENDGWGSRSYEVLKIESDSVTSVLRSSIR